MQVHSINNVRPKRSCIRERDPGAHQAQYAYRTLLAARDRAADGTEVRTEPMQTE